MDILQKLRERYIDFCAIKGDSLYFPDLDITLRAKPYGDDEERVAGIEFRLTSSYWDREIRDVTSGLGDDRETAFEAALNSFINGMFDGIVYLMKDEFGLVFKMSQLGIVMALGFADISNSKQMYKREEEIEYGGIRRKLKVYLSQILKAGEYDIEFEDLWNLVGDMVLLRIGNQKTSYVKMFFFKAIHEEKGTFIEAECSINGDYSKEISDVIRDFVSRIEIAPNSGIRYKQTGFIVQNNNTYTPYPYAQEDINENLKTAVDLFAQCESPADYFENYFEKLAETIGDRDLAAELFAFIPELCAANFYEIENDERILIRMRGMQKYFYKSQIAGYGMIRKAWYSAAQNGIISEELFARYSSISNLERDVYEAENPVEHAKTCCMTCYFYDDYTFR